MLLMVSMVGLLSIKTSAWAVAPPIAEVHKAALHYARLDELDDVKWKKRAKVAAILPRLQFDFGHRLDATY